MARRRDSRENKSLERSVSPADAKESSSADMPRAFLEQVVSETKAQLSALRDVDVALRPALVEVAQRYPGQSLVLEPIGVALLEAMLRPSFPILAARPALLASTARAVARTLLGDPTAHRRLEHLWHCLLEESAHGG